MKVVKLIDVQAMLHEMQNGRRERMAKILAFPVGNASKTASTADKEKYPTSAADYEVTCKVAPVD